MTLYNINLSLGWSNSGVEYAQAYRERAFSHLGISSAWVFMNLVTNGNIYEMADKLGLPYEDVLWMPLWFTDQTPSFCTVHRDSLPSLYGFKPKSVEEVGALGIKYVHHTENMYLMAYRNVEGSELIHRVEIVRNGYLIKKDFYHDRLVFTEFYSPREGKASLDKRVYYNADGSIAYEEIVRGDKSCFKLGVDWVLSKAELYDRFFKGLEFSEGDLILLDRASGIAQQVFQNKNDSALGVIVHAEHWSKASEGGENILWNNFYEYQFQNHKYVDFYVCATFVQANLLEKHFRKYLGIDKRVVCIPVGHYEENESNSIPLTEMDGKFLTVSRLANEKHVDVLVKAIAHLRSKGVDVSLDIYGAGNQFLPLKEMINDLGVSQWVSLKGHQDMTGVYSQYCGYLTASQSEGFGLTLMEAVASGRGIVGFDVPYGNQTFISDGLNGYLLEAPDDWGSDDTYLRVADAIEMYLSLKPMTVELESRRLAVFYRLSRVAREWRKVIGGFMK